MPRLLLVDDNPSIHKIAETLLASTDIALACASSGAEALALVDKGEHFDVAMLDISMMGMDGWELLGALRKREPTARMPVAMMAGVLDVVDPDKVSRAPIQGFLKKPVELRDLADRVKHLLTLPVLPPAPEPVPEPVPPPAAFATTPGFKLADHPGVLEHAPEVPDDLLILGPEDLFPGEPTIRTDEVPGMAPEEVPEEALGDLPGLDEPLDLEELDLDSLRGLTAPPEPEPAFPVEPQASSLRDDLARVADPAELMDFTIQDELESMPAPAHPAEEPIQALEIPDFAPGDADGEPEGAAEPAQAAVAGPTPQVAALAASMAEFDDLPDLFPSGTEPPSDAAQAQAAPVDPDFLDWSDDSESLLAELSSAPPPFDPELPDVGHTASEALVDILDPTPASLSLEVLEAEPPAPPVAEVLDATFLETLEVLSEDSLEELPALEAPAPALAEAAPALAEAAPASVFLPAPAPPEAPVTPQPPAAAGPADLDPLAAILADPVLMDRLSKAVVARLGDQILREIAWEVIPDLAERIQRN